MSKKIIIPAETKENIKNLLINGAIVGVSTALKYVVNGLDKINVGSNNNTDSYCITRAEVNKENNLHGSPMVTFEDKK